MSCNVSAWRIPAKAHVSRILFGFCPRGADVRRAVSYSFYYVGVFGAYKRACLALSTRIIYWWWFHSQRHDTHTHTFRLRWVLCVCVIVCTPTTSDTKHPAQTNSTVPYEQHIMSHPANFPLHSMHNKRRRQSKWWKTIRVFRAGWHNDPKPNHNRIVRGSKRVCWVKHIMLVYFNRT